MLPCPSTIIPRTNVIHSGTAFTAAHNLLFGYNDRNELIAADRYAGEDQQQHTAAPFAYDYVYDPIGNRTTFTADDSATSTSYSRNNVNQYTATGDPNEAFDYDDDGNMIEDGTYTYVWDGENRLREVYPSSPDSNSKKLVFAYDYMGRRVHKQVFGYDTQAQDWEETADTDLKFVYDQWNVIMVLDGKNSDAIQSKYTWGLDMSGSLHGAGGIGGLLAWEATAAQNSPTFWYLYDGNGNVGQLVKASDQSTAATYEYDPYGNVIVSSGTYADINPIRFSTKWFDESGLGYWGYRYYSPRLGRWLNRDPIEQIGGLNIYSFVLNHPCGLFDPFGNIPCGAITQSSTSTVISTTQTPNWWTGCWLVTVNDIIAGANAYVAKIPNTIVTPCPSGKKCTCHKVFGPKTITITITTPTFTVCAGGCNVTATLSVTTTITGYVGTCK